MNRFNTFLLRQLFKQLTLILLFTNITNQGYSQSKTLTLVDNSDFTPIGYAEVINTNTGKYYMTNIQGQTAIRTRIGDVLKIHALGYRDVNIVFDEDTVLSLQKSYNELPDISLVNKDIPIITIGNKSKKLRMGLGMMTGNRFSYQVGLLIDNSDSLLLQSVSFYVNESCEKGAVYRLRLYELDGENPNKSKDLLNSSMVLNLTCKSCWEEILLPHSLFTDKNILVALEWLPDALVVDTDNGYGLTKVNSLNFFVSRSYYGDECNMFNKAIFNSEDTGWSRFCPGSDSTAVDNKPLNLMINLKAANLK
jgi:hypothetical protein